MLSFNPIHENLQDLQNTNGYLSAELLKKRQKRYRDALNSSLDQHNLLVTLAPTLESLQLQLANFERINLIHPSVKTSETISRIQNRISSGDYAKENDAALNLRREVEMHAQSFVWPDANELIIRQQEEAELLALLG